jgi:hypothetical protein
MKIWVVSCGLDAPGPNRCGIPGQVDLSSEVHHLIAVDNFGENKIEQKEAWTIYYRKEHLYAIGNTVNMLADNDHLINNDDIIVLVDSDDYIVPDALAVIEHAYKDPNVWLTHGSYRMLSGRPARFNGAYKSDNFRQLPWRASHPKTFRYGLFNHLGGSDLLDKNGKAFQIASDHALMFPLMELTGLDRIRYIPDEIYVYNDLNPFNVHKVHKKEQKAADNYIRSIPPRERLAAWV